MCASVELMKEAGAYAGVVSHHLRGIHALQKAHSDMRFLKVATRKNGKGAVVSTYALEEGIAASSFGLQEAARQKWPGIETSIAYFNRLVRQYGMPVFARARSRGKSRAGKQRPRGYFLTHAKKVILDLRGYRDAIVRSGGWSRKNRGSPEYLVRDEAGGYIANIMADPSAVDYDMWVETFMTLWNDEQLFRRFGELLHENWQQLEIKEREKQLGSSDIVTIYKPDPRASFSRFDRLVRFCAKSGVPALELYGSRLRVFMGTPQGRGFMRIIMEKGFVDGYKKELAASSHGRNETDWQTSVREAITALCAIYTASRFFKEHDEAWDIPVRLQADSIIQVEDGVHTSVLDHEGKTPNDVCIAPSAEGRGGLLVYTGFNTGGKTTMGKMIGQIVALAQAGWPVPAAYARVSECTDIQILSPDLREAEQQYKRSGGKKRGALEDALFRSGMMLRTAGPRNLSILDEPFSGAAESSVAGALADELTQRGAAVILITHQLDVVGFLVEQVPHAQCFMPKTRGKAGMVTPFYKFIDGVAMSSHGLQVARDRNWIGYGKARTYYEIIGGDALPCGSCSPVPVHQPMQSGQYGCSL